MLKAASLWLGISLAIATPIFAQNNSIKSTPIFQSQFSRNKEDLQLLE